MGDDNGGKKVGTVEILFFFGSRLLHYIESPTIDALGPQPFPASSLGLGYHAVFLP